MTAIRIPATYMRGGTSKGLFFHAPDLPADPAERERLLLRVIGSPDPYGKQIDGMGAATSSTSKIVILSRSARDDSDVDYLFGQVSIDRPMIDWSGNCGNLTAAVGPYAIAHGLVKVPSDGVAAVRIWQANVRKRIVAHVPVRNGEVVEAGDFELDGVTFPSAEIRIEFLDPGGGDESADTNPTGTMFPTGQPLETLDIPGVGPIEATLINAGNPTIFIDAAALGLRGNELQDDVNGDAAMLARFEAIRAHCAVAMGLTRTAAEATANRQHTPKIAFIGGAQPYTASSGKAVTQDDIDFCARIVSMGKLHHAMTGTGAVAIAVAAAIPGTLVARYAKGRDAGRTRFGHPSGTLTVGAEATQTDGRWVVSKAIVSRSARVLMEGWVRLPGGE